MDNKRPLDVGFIFFGVIPSIICVGAVVVSLIGVVFPSEQQRHDEMLAYLQHKTQIENTKIEAVKLRGNPSPEGLAANTIHISSNCKQ